MQISGINTYLPGYTASFKSNRRDYESGRTSRRYEYEQNEVPTPQYSVQRGEKRRTNAIKKKSKEIAKTAVICATVGAAIGAVGGNYATDQAIKSKAMQNPIAIIEHISGAPRDLIYEWQMNGMTIYPQQDTSPIVSNKAEYTQIQLNAIQKAQNDLADVFYNKTNGIVYAVLNKDSDVREIKATFGIRMSTDTSIERLNNLHNKQTIGADLNTAKLAKGTIIRFERSESGEKGNFYGSLLNQVQN